MSEQMIQALSGHSEDFGFKWRETPLAAALSRRDSGKWAEADRIHGGLWKHILCTFGGALPAEWSRQAWEGGSEQPIIANVCCEAGSIVRDVVEITLTPEEGWAE